VMRRAPTGRTAAGPHHAAPGGRPGDEVGRARRSSSSTPRRSRQRGGTSAMRSEVASSASPRSMAWPSRAQPLGGPVTAGRVERRPAGRTRAARSGRARRAGRAAAPRRPSEEPDAGGGADVVGDGPDVVGEDVVVPAAVQGVAAAVTAERTAAPAVRPPGRRAAGSPTARHRGRGRTG
jgi:hypothetical protein